MTTNAPLKQKLARQQQLQSQKKTAALAIVSWPKELPMTFKNGWQFGLGFWFAYLAVMLILAPLAICALWVLGVGTLTGLSPSF